jgi:T4 bacteriophage base plate protein
MSVTVHPLSANDILQLWEWGQDKHPVDRALGLLRLACPELPPEELQSLTIGQRNSRLLALRERTLGPALKGFARCSQCGAELEFAVEVEAIRLPEPEAQEYSLEVDGLTLRVRPLNSLDLASIVGLGDVGAARLRLIERCLLEASQEGQSLAAAELPDSALSALMDALSEGDPQAEMRFQLTCAACGHRWPALFDIVSFFWTEVGARAGRLLAEVHVLARAYGWREADILALSEARRQSYLELVS